MGGMPVHDKDHLLERLQPVQHVLEELKDGHLIGAFNNIEMEESLIGRG